MPTFVSIVFVHIMECLKLSWFSVRIQQKHIQHTIRRAVSVLASVLVRFWSLPGSVSFLRLTRGSAACAWTHTWTLTSMAGRNDWVKAALHPTIQHSWFFQATASLWSLWSHMTPLPGATEVTTAPPCCPRIRTKKVPAWKWFSGFQWFRKG